MTVSIWQASNRQPIQDVDVLIVGAGLAGCTAAYFAAQSGYDVVITEKADFAMGASGRNAGFMITGLDAYYHMAVEKYGEATTREMWTISEVTHRHWDTFIKNSDGRVQVEQCGSLLLAESKREAKDVEQAARALDKAGIPIQFHSNDPLGRGYYAAIEQPHDKAVQPYHLVETILQQSRATFIPNNELYHIEQEQSDCVTVYTRQIIFKARYVMLCTNAYSVQIDPFFRDKIIPTRAQCLVTTPLETPVLDTCGYSDYGYMYYRTTFDGRLLIGGGRNRYKMLEHDTLEDRTNDEVQGVLKQYLRDKFPEVTAPIERRWAGIMGFCVDGLPIVGTLPNKPRVGYAVGFTGHGLATSAGVVERAVDLLLNGTHPGAVSADRLL